MNKFKYPLVFVHGMWVAKWVFVPLMLSLKALGYECHAFDLRGHGDGKQVKDLGRVSIYDYVDDVNEFLADLGRPCVLIGWSMGALIAALVAKDNPSVKAYVGIASAPHRWTGMTSEVMKNIWSYILDMFSWRSIRLSNQHARLLMGNTLPEYVFKEAVSMLQPESGRVALRIATLSYNVGKLDCPALVIGFKDDNIVCGQRKIAHNLGAEYEEVAGCHLSILEDANRRGCREVCRIIDEWQRRKF